MWYKILQIILVPLINKLWDLVENWVANEQMKRDKTKDDKETKDEIDRIENGGRPDAS